MANWYVDLDSLSLLLLSRKGLRIDPWNALLPFPIIYAKEP